MTPRPARLAAAARLANSARLAVAGRAESALNQAAARRPIRLGRGQALAR
jgi:hypothetical protein